MDRMKYPRTFHLPWSPGAASDDKVLKSVHHFDGERVILTVKMDGENTTMYRDYLHARSMDYQHHPSRSWVRGLHGRIAHDIPEGYRVCGENLYAQHSIGYEHLTSYFQVFSVWNQNVCLSWDETVEWTKLLGLQTVPVLYAGCWDPALFQRYFMKEKTTHEGDLMEGYVIRVARSFDYNDFDRSVAKYVRANHVTTDQHWKEKPVVPNGLQEKE